MTVGLDETEPPETYRCRRCAAKVELAEIRWDPRWGNICMKCSTEIETDEGKPPEAA